MRVAMNQSRIPAPGEATGQAKHHVIFYDDSATMREVIKIAFRRPKYQRDSLCRRINPSRLLQLNRTALRGGTD